MPADLQRVAELKAGPRKNGKTSFGSGYLIADRLVLTAGHVVCEDGVPLSKIHARFVGMDGGRTEPLTCELAWHQTSDQLDAALVKVTDPRWHPPSGLTPVRWGQLTGHGTRVECDAVGYPHASWNPALGRDTEHVSGHINPATYALGRRYAIDVDAPPDYDPQRPSRWSGMSGAALLCGKLVTGVVIWDPPAFGSRRLIVVPAAELLVVDEFCRHVYEAAGRPPVLESAELSGLLRMQTSSPPPASPAGLLRADVAAVRWRGRQDMLDRLAAWLAAPATLLVELVTGQGGQGKTRLAREFAERMRQGGWVTGTLDDREPTRRQLEQFSQSARPLLVVVDYADSRPAHIRDLALSIVRRGTERPIRLLLLARSAGDWWERLRLHDHELGHLRCHDFDVSPEFARRWPLSRRG